MKLLIDTNIVLDVLLKREPFYQNAVKVMNLAQRENLDYLSWLLRRRYGDTFQNGKVSKASGKCILQSGNAYAIILLSNKGAMYSRATRRKTG